VIISAIVAKAKNNIIGKDNDLPWHLPGDLKWFKNKTLNRHVIMGRKSFESLPGILPNRVHVVITRDQSYFHSNIVVKHSIDEALAYAHQEGEDEVFILGGGIIYSQTQDLWQRLYLTEVDAEPEGDTYFPEVNYDQFKLAFDEHHKADEKNQYSYTFKIYERGL
jgi:dihydrofolate reductase